MTYSAVYPIIAAAAKRAGYGNAVAEALMSSLILHLMTMKEITPEGVTKLAEQHLPDIVATLAADAAQALASLPASQTVH